MENPLQQREVKTTGASQQNFTISRVFTNAMGYLMMRFNPSRWLTRSINMRQQRYNIAYPAQAYPVTGLALLRC
jgi:hypothetical protein